MNHPHLTRRQLEVLARVQRGLGNKDIAWSMGVTESSVNNLLRRMYMAYGVHNRTALMVVTKYGGLDISADFLPFRDVQ